MNLLNTIRLKISKFFYPQPTFKDWLADSLSENNRDRLRLLAGLKPKKQKSAAERAHNRLQTENLNKEYKKLLSFSGKVNQIKKWAIDEAERTLERDELALAMADAMEQRNKKIDDEKISFDESWNKYVKKHIRKRDPKAADFAKFLVKYDFVTAELLDDVSVTAIFYNNKIYNFSEFRLELKRVNQPIAA